MRHIKDTMDKKENIKVAVINIGIRAVVADFISHASTFKMHT